MFITITILVYHYYTNTKDRPCISPPYISPPLYKPIKNRLRKYISTGLIVGGLRYPANGPRSSSSPGTLGHAHSPQSLGHTDPEVQENLQQFLKRMLLNWDALAPVTMFKVNYEKRKYFSVDILTG